MTPEDEAKWHWDQGIKFALEGIKLLFLLNGASAVSVLTFDGRTKSGSASLIWAMLLFAVGAVTVVPAMILAYLTQLNYGNGSQGGSGAQNSWKLAGTMHNSAYVAIGLSILLFLCGASCATYGLFHP